MPTCKLQQLVAHLFWYERPYCLDKAEIDAHREKIAEEERHAKSVSKTQLMNYSWSLRSNSEEIHNAVDA